MVEPPAGGVRRFAEVSGAVLGCSPLRDGPGGRTLAGEMQAAGEPRRLSLEVRFDAEPIRGRVCEDTATGREDRPFCGWLGLMAAIDAAAAGRPYEPGGAAP